MNGWVVLPEVLRKGGAACSLGQLLGYMGKIIKQKAVEGCFLPFQLPDPDRLGSESEGGLRCQFFKELPEFQLLDDLFGQFAQRIRRDRLLEQSLCGAFSLLLNVGWPVRVVLSCPDPSKKPRFTGQHETVEDITAAHVALKCKNGSITSLRLCIPKVCPEFLFQDKGDFLAVIDIGVDRMAPFMPWRQALSAEFATRKPWWREIMG